MDELHFHRATAADWQTVAEIERLGANDFYISFHKKKDILSYIKGSTVFILMIGDRAVGMVSYETDEHENIFIDTLVVIPEFRAHGIGTQAMKKIMKDLGNRNYSLLVHPDNIPAVKIYLGLGFAIKERKENPFGDGQPRILMEKTANVPE